MIKTSIKTITIISACTALICVCSWLTVPFAVPFTMQTFAVFFSLLVLGGKYGTAAVCLYLLLGAVGVPVFSGFQGGVGHLLGPTGGYIIGFVFSGIIYLLFEPAVRKIHALKWAALSSGLAACYLIGTVWFVFVSRGRGDGTGFLSAVTVCVLPYIVPDLLKMWLAVFLASRVSGTLKTGKA